MIRSLLDKEPRTGARGCRGMGHTTTVVHGGGNGGASKGTPERGDLDGERVESERGRREKKYCSTPMKGIEAGNEREAFACNRFIDRGDFSFFLYTYGRFIRLIPVCR